MASTDCDTMEELCQDPDNSRVETWLNSQGDQGGAALLHYAAAKGSLEVVKFLLPFVCLLRSLSFFCLSF